MTKTPRKLDGLDPLLMPQSSPPVSEAVGAEAEGAHRVPDLVASADPKWQVALKRGDKEAWGLDRAAVPLPFGEFSPQPYSAPDRVYVGRGKRQCFRYTRTQLLHDDGWNPKTRLDTFQHGDDLVLIGWIGLTAHYAWQLHLPVPSDVGDVSEVQHHAEIPDEQTDGTGLVLGGEDAHPLDDVADVDVLYRLIAERVEKLRGTEPVAGQGAVADVAAGRQPFRVYMSKQRTSNDGPLEFRLRVLGASEPFPDEMTAYRRLPLCTECSAMLNLRIATSTAVPHVEPAAVPGVPRTNIESRHQ